MSAYILFMTTEPDLDTEQLSQMQRVGDQVERIVESFGGVYRVRLQPFDVHEGSVAADRISLVEFPTMKQLRNFYDSEQYRPYLEMRAMHQQGTLLVFGDTD